MTTHQGECFCGAVKVEVVGEPEGMGYWQTAHKADSKRSAAVRRSCPAV